jgi:outer membrane protein TolC
VLTDNSTLSDYIRYAMLNNPGVEAAFNRWKAALERIPQARALSDPVLSYRVFVRVVDQRQAFSVEQMLPWFGKLELAASMALEESEAERQKWEAERLKLYYRVEDAYYEYWYVARAIEIIRENRDLMKYFEEIVRARYRVNQAQYGDLIRAQVELDKMEDELRSMSAMREPTAAKLNAALNRPPGSPLPWPKAVPEQTLDIADDELTDILARTSPELKAMEHDIAKEKRGIELANKMFYPDFAVGVDLMHMVMPDMGDQLAVAIMTGITLPIWREKYRAGVREAEAKLVSAQKMKLDRENMLDADVKMAVFGLRDAERKIGLYRDSVIPKSREALKATEASFRAGTAGFLDLLDVQRTLVEFQLSYERARANRAQRIAEIEMLVGRQLPKSKPADATEKKE